MKKFFCLILLTLLTFAAFSQETEITTITIMSARQTAYKKAEETGDDVIELEGSVVLSVQKNSTTTEIKADKVTYDRKTEMLYAEGNVEIDTKSSSSGGEKTTADTLLMNTSTLEGIFDGGRVVQTKSDALNLPSGSTLIVFSEIFGKSSDNIIAFKNSSLTFCDAEVPHWHIDATRTWLLPGGEFAFFNALLYVGVVPVLYFPAFYYPKDELIFNPVFSYREREGTSIQTTTYLWGRKPLSDTSSSSSSSSSSETSDVSTSAESLKAIYNFVKPSTLKEQKLEGIVLHNLDEDYSGDTSQYVKFLADWYSNLGFFTGIDANFNPENQYVSKFAFNLNLGLSNTIFKNEDKYYPFYTDGFIFEDSSNFMGKHFPFRYSGKIDFELSKPINLSLSLPVYSDPYYAYDFLTNRVETMDWISYFLDNNTKNSEDTNVSVSEISSFTWQLNSSYSPSIPSIINPYISSLSMRLNSSVNFASKNVEKRTVTNKNKTVTEESLFYKDRNGVYLEETKKNSEVYEQWRKNTPNRRFYYPSSVTPAAFDFSLSGTIFQWPIEKRSSNSTYTEYAININKPNELKTEKQIQEEALAEQANSESVENDVESENSELSKSDEPVELEEVSDEEKIFDYNMPSLDYSPAFISLSDGISYRLGYNIGANLTSQLTYSANHLYTAEDFDWENVRSYMYTLKLPASVSSNFNYGGEFFSLNNTVSYSPVYQKHPYLLEEEEKGGYSETEKDNILFADYNAENRDVLNSNTVTLKPLIYTGMFSDSNITWNSSYKLYRRKFTGTAKEPEWEVEPFDWDDEDCVTANTLAATISAGQLNNLFKQNLTFSIVMPPLLRQFTTTLGLSFPYVTASFSTGFQELTKDDGPVPDTNGKMPETEFKKWKKSPFNQNLTVNLFDSKLQLSESYVYNLEDDNNESLKFSASGYGLSMGYSMTYTTGYDFDKDTGWSVRKEKEFLPYAIDLSYNLNPKTYYSWGNRISFAPGVSFNINADLLRPTNSYLVFSPKLTFVINEFLNVSFSSTSKNSILYWYFNEGLYDEGGPFPGNMFADLINSFRFDNTAKREGSGFKLSSLNMSITHELHDWKFSMTMKVEPRLIRDKGPAYYDFNPYITIGVVWNPMESIKTSIIDDYGEWKLE